MWDAQEVKGDLQILLRRCAYGAKGSTAHIVYESRQCLHSRAHGNCHPIDRKDSEPKADLHGVGRRIGEQITVTSSNCGTDLKTAFNKRHRPFQPAYLSHEYAPFPVRSSGNYSPLQASEMTSNNIADSTGVEDVPTVSYTRSGQTEDTLVTLEGLAVQHSEATDSARQREVPRTPSGDVSSISPSTATRTSIDITRASQEYQESVIVEGLEGTVEPRETHAFLHEDHHDTVSTQSTKPKNKGNRKVLLTTWRT